MKEDQEFIPELVKKVEKPEYEGSIALLLISEPDVTTNPEEFMKLVEQYKDKFNSEEFINDFGELRDMLINQGIEKEIVFNYKLGREKYERISLEKSINR